MSYQGKESGAAPLTIDEQIADAQFRSREKEDRLLGLHPNGLSLRLAIPVNEVLFTLRKPNLTPDKRLAAWEDLNSVYDRLLARPNTPQR